VFFHAGLTQTVHGQVHAFERAHFSFLAARLLKTVQQVSGRVEVVCDVAKADAGIGGCQWQDEHGLLLQSRNGSPPKLHARGVRGT
jgi:hypothetical protein